AGTVVGAVWWGRNQIEALKEQLATKDVIPDSKDAALVAKDEQLKAQLTKLDYYQRTSPGEMVGDAEALKTWADQARSNAEIRVAEEREQLTRELDRVKRELDAPGRRSPRERASQLA